MRVDAQSKVTLEGVTFTTCPVDDMSWQLQAKQIELDTQSATARVTEPRSTSSVCR